jgi:hypothetical protein
MEGNKSGDSILDFIFAFRNYRVGNPEVKIG